MADRVRDSSIPNSIAGQARARRDERHHLREESAIVCATSELERPEIDGLGRPLAVADRAHPAACLERELLPPLVGDCPPRRPGAQAWVVASPHDVSSALASWAAPLMAPHSTDREAIPELEAWHHLIVVPHLGCRLLREPLEEQRHAKGRMAQGRAGKATAPNERAAEDTGRRARPGKRIPKNKYVRIHKKSSAEGASRENNT